jgi:hypothetical protein
MGIREGRAVLVTGALCGRAVLSSGDKADHSLSAHVSAK